VPLEQVMIEGDHPAEDLLLARTSTASTSRCPAITAKPELAGCSSTALQSD